MGVFENLYFKTNANAKDITRLFNPLLLGEGFNVKMFMKQQRHVLYSNGKIEFDFWWESGNRPTLFIRNSGEPVRSDIYEKLLQKHNPNKVHIGRVSHYLHNKLDRDIYYGEHYTFVENYLKSQ